MGSMTRCGASLAALLAAAAPAVASAQTLAEQLAWAYAITPGPAPPATPDDGTLHSLPGSTGKFTRTQISNRMGPADWYPGDHPTMPPIVAKGREAAGVWACSLCHYPNGKGRPENAGVAGLPKEYFIQQMYDFKNGARMSADARKPNTPIMAGFAVQMTDEEIRAAADYFGSMKWTPWIQVVETDTVPKTRIAGGMHLKLEGAEAGTEPLGQRIVETPVNAEHTELLRNPRSGFIAYVPKGSVKRGEELARFGNEGVTACTVCHGQDLNGLAMVPSLRGRSPSYIARQLADMKEGKRHGAWTPLMEPVVASLGAEDILNLAAYLTSLEPLP
ncbi:MAG TPA: c-type cytochrome [Gammaproteobacteria bacterium]|nr:c-type cytochrome [Gammaproteobacteria bacterium]